MVFAAIAALAFVLSAAPANADPNAEESDFSVDLVQQAISLIANDGGAERALEKMQDALEAPDPSGVDLALVEQAVTVVEDAGGASAGQEALSEARALLLQAAPALAKPPQGPMATGEDPATTLVLDPFEPERGISDGGDVVLLILALGAIALGLFLARLWRPRHTLAQLRRMQGTGTDTTTRQEARS